jgi:hypothetical protein
MPTFSLKTVKDISGDSFMRRRFRFAQSPDEDAAAFRDYIKENDGIEILFPLFWVDEGDELSERTRLFFEEWVHAERSDQWDAYFSGLRLTTYGEGVFNLVYDAFVGISEDIYKEALEELDRLF